MALANMGDLTGKVCILQEKGGFCPWHVKMFAKKNPAKIEAMEKQGVTMAAHVELPGMSCHGAQRC